MRASLHSRIRLFAYILLILLAIFVLVRVFVSFESSTLAFTHMWLYHFNLTASIKIIITFGPQSDEWMRVDVEAQHTHTHTYTQFLWWWLRCVTFTFPCFAWILHTLTTDWLCGDDGTIRFTKTMPSLYPPVTTVTTTTTTTVAHTHTQYLQVHQHLC